MSSPVLPRASRTPGARTPSGPSLLSRSLQQHHRSVSESGVQRRLSSHGQGNDGAQREPLDLTAQLLRSGHAVVKSRTGSVLSRGFIMKTDHYPSGRALDLDLNLHGAPNFRSARKGDLNVFGVAQPRTQGLRAILSVLRARPGTRNPTRVVWFSSREEPVVYVSGRPFVLRDSAEPRTALRLSDRAENLEAIETRLKADILAEAAKYGGLLLTHNEAAVSGIADGQAAILPTWTSVDNGNVKTMRELMGQMAEQGWNVEYHRIPISPDRGIEDNYLDAYLRIILQTSPTDTALVFSCGTGAARTTLAMVAASVVRRKQMLERGLSDPFSLPLVGTSMSVASGLISRTSTPGGPAGGIDPARSSPTSQMAEIRIAQSLEAANAQQDMNRSLLRLTYLLQQTLNSQSAIELLLSQPGLLDNLRKAHMGNYGVVLSLLGCLDNGLRAKKLVDIVIDSSDHVTNLREEILTERVEYSQTTSTIDLDDVKREEILNKAVRSLERYFFLIAFTSYVEEQGDWSQKFSDWLQTRTEIWNQVTFLRKSYGSRLNIFAPVDDLSALSKSQDRAVVPGQKNDVAIFGGLVYGDEYADHVVKNRAGIILREGTLLKSDQWLSESQHVEREVRGAINFRKIPDTQIYALGQPTSSAIDEVVGRIKQEHPGASSILWITLREEPIVYVNGSPYCLRRERFSLRNMKDYGGISASRLEVLEERLRDDVLSELANFGGRLLLHTETSNGSVVPIWEDVEPQDVVTLADLMASRRSAGDDVQLQYKRIPITAERPPDFTDMSDLMEVVIRSHATETPIVVNCQLGRGRSTLISIILTLIQNWLHNPGFSIPPTPAVPRGRRPSPHRTKSLLDDFEASRPPSQRHSYQIINNLLRVIRKGRLVKDTVDDAIDRCDAVENLRDSIEDARVRAEESSNNWEQKELAQTGLQALRRYFQLILFQAYLQSTEPDTLHSFETFESFVKDRPVIKTFEKELLADGISALKPLERVDPAEGEESADEIKQIVTNRSGSILSASTILKSDFFSNLQKMSLPERIEGSPNFRRVPLTFHISKSSFVPNINGRMVCGSGMPTVEGLRRALERVGAGPNGVNTVFWTSLREEPVIYVARRPHVLRLVDRPLENVEATGVTTAMVEAMEVSLKKDVIREVIKGNGRILLHDEIEERPGVFSIVSIWEHVTEADILTPRDVYNQMVSEGYRVNYGRVAITDEQAPLPEALAQLVDRVKGGLQEPCDFVFSCQMGRGRTTSGMVTASLIATTLSAPFEDLATTPDDQVFLTDTIDGPSEEEAYLEGEYKTILQLVGVLSHGKMAKLLTDKSIDLMQDVQNLRKAIYPFKLKVDAAQKGSEQQRKYNHIGVNYLYRYGALIAFANYLIETREGLTSSRFPDWLKEHREISTLLNRTSLD